MMTIDDFRGSVSHETPPSGLGPALEALWWAFRGDWARAHECVQAHEGVSDCDLVHAHLHRQEGDLSNAAYWYRRAGRSLPDQTLEQEWSALATGMLRRR